MLDLIQAGPTPMSIEGFLSVVLVLLLMIALIFVLTRENKYPISTYKLLTFLSNPENIDRSRVLIVTASTLKSRPYANESAAINRKYAEINGYSFLFVDLDEHPDYVPRGIKENQDMLRTSLGPETSSQTRTPHWAKMEIARRHLPSCDYLFWIDDDAIFLDPSKKLETIIQLSDGADFTVCRDIGGKSTAINSGTMLFRNTPFMLDKIAEIIDSPASVPYYRKHFHEQTMIDKLLIEPEIPGARYQVHYGNLKSAIDRGFPIRSKHLCILNENVMNGAASSFVLHLAATSSDYRLNVFSTIRRELEQRGFGLPPVFSPYQIFPWDCSEVSFAPRSMDIRGSGPKREIAKKIHQNFKTAAVPSFLLERMISWVGQQDYSYDYHTNVDSRRDIEQAVASGELPMDVLEAYDLLYVDRYKADLWRYCHLYLHGGIQADIRMKLLTDLNSFIEEDDTLLLVLSPLTGPALCNDFIACRARHPLIMKTIQNCVKQILERSYPEEEEAITGPVLFGRTIFHELEWPAEPSIGRHKTKYGTISLLTQRKSHGEYIENSAGRVVISCFPEQLRPHTKQERIYYHQITGQPDSTVLWAKKQVYLR